MDNKILTNNNELAHNQTVMIKNECISWGNSSKRIMCFRCLLIDYGANRINANILSPYIFMWANEISLYFFVIALTLTSHFTNHWHLISKYWIDMANLFPPRKRDTEETSSFIDRSYVPSSCQWNKILCQVDQKARNMSLLFINNNLIIHNGKDYYILKFSLFKW